MKPSTVVLGEMTRPELEAFLVEHSTVIVPVGATEQHGPHGPLGTDSIVPAEVARRVAPRIGAVVAPSINYALSFPHAGFVGVVPIRIPTFMTLIEDVCESMATTGFRRVIFLNGHYDNAYPIAFACANARPRLPEAVRAYNVNYWEGLTPAEWAEFADPAGGLHANLAETAAVLAIDPAIVDMEKANTEMPPFPPVGNVAAVHAAWFFTQPGSVFRATKSGTWGDPRGATPELGRRYLDAVVEGTIRLIEDIERTYDAMPPRRA